MRVVLDTNVIISGLNFPGTERIVLGWARSGHYELYLSQHIVQETVGVLQRKFGWDDSHTRRAIRVLMRSAVIVEPTQQVSRIPDHPADNLILSTALGAQAEFIVTGDRKHLLPLRDHQGIRLITPADFLRLIDGV